VALNTLGLGFLFTARDMASGVMMRVNRTFNSTASKTAKSMSVMQGAMVAAGVGLAAVGAGLGIVAAGFGMANKYAAFEQSVAAVGAVTKATATELDALKEAAIQAGIETQFSPDEATQGLLSLATAGQTATDSTKTLIPVLDLAAGSLGQLGVAESAEAVVGTLNAYGMAAEEAAGTTDKLLRITQLSNFQARDFSIGLSKAAAAGATFGQNLDDVLITMGLLRNRNIDASSSATALRESLRRVGSDKNAQKAVEDVGVEVFGADKKMRSIVDIMSDFAIKTEDLSAKERNRAVVQAFGARGLLAFNAIQKATFTEMVKGEKIVHKGAAAIEAMRKKMGDAKGTAAAFREALLDTFEGQKTLIKGSLETLGVVAGEGFAATFKPLISVMIQGLNFLIKVIKATPTPVKQAFAAAALLFGGFLTGGGAVTMLVAAIALLIPVIKIVAIVLGVVLLAVLPVIAALGALTFAVLGFVTAFQEVEGLGGKAVSIFEKIKLGFRALSQVFSQGGFSGEVKKELDKAENEGIKNFAIKVFLFVERIKNAWEGLVKGFRGTIKAAKPAFDAFLNALDQLGKRLGVFGEEADADDAASKFDAWGKKGEQAGKMLGDAFVKLVQIMTFATTATTVAVDAWNEVKPVLELLRMPMKQLADALQLFNRQLDASSGKAGDATSDWQSFATVLQAVFVIATAMVGAFITLTSIIVSGVAAGMSAAWNVVLAVVHAVWGAMQFVYFFLTGQWGKAWEVARETVISVGGDIVNAIMDLVAGIASAIDALAAVAGKDLGLAKKVAAKQAAFNRKAEKQKQLRTAGPGQIQTGGLAGVAAKAALAAGPVVAPAAPGAFIGPPLPPEMIKAQAETAGGIEKVASSVSAAVKGIKIPSPTVTTQLVVDGEVLAEAVKKAGESGTDFAPSDNPQP